MKTKIISITTALLLSITVFPVISAPVTISLDLNPASPYLVNIGDSLSIDVVVSELDGEIVSAYDLDVHFSPTVLQADSIDFGPWLGDDSFFEVFESSVMDNNSGLLDFASLSLLSDSDLASLQAPATGAFTLATLNFTAIADNITSGITFSWAAGNDIKGANNQVLNIPEPQMLLLLIFGWLATATVVHRRKLQR